MRWTHAQVLLLIALRMPPAWGEQQWMSAVSQAHLECFLSLGQILQGKYVLWGKVFKKNAATCGLGKKKIPAKVDFPHLSVEKSGSCTSPQHCLPSIIFWNSIINLCIAADVSAGIKALLCRMYKCEETSSSVREKKHAHLISRKTKILVTGQKLQGLLQNCLGSSIFSCLHTSLAYNFMWCALQRGVL